MTFPAAPLTGPRTLLCLLLGSLSVAGACTSDWQAEDADGDGISVADGDCWDEVEGPEGSGLLGADIFPGAQEDWYDGFDQDCGDDDDFDADKDGYVPSAFAGLSTYGVGTSGALPGGDCWDDPGAIPQGFLAAAGYPQLAAGEVNPAATADTWYDGIDQDCRGDSDFDQDLDGYDSADDPQADGSTGPDCDDGDPAFSPDAEEVCDSLDNDCDELVDGEDDSVDPASVRTFYVDEDQDGYGDDDNAIVSCDDLEGYILQGGDCADGDAEINPAADETCNDVDDNCNGSTDEAAVDAPSWYQDADGDDYGDVAEAVAACDVPEGYVGNAADCDDGAAAINPDADERCETAGIDDDCDELIDELGAVDGDIYYTDGDGDGYGLTSSTMRACRLEDGYAEEGGDCADGNAAVNPDADERCSTAGVDDDCDGRTDDSTAVDTNVYYADLDDDGYGDADNTVDACSRPSGYVSNTNDCDDACDACWTGADEVCSDYEDNDCDGTDNGCGLAASYDVSDLTIHIQGMNDGDELGLAAGHGDMDGDGVDDLILCASDADGGNGQAYVFLGPVRSSSSAVGADLILTGEASDDRAGRAVALADIDRDGFDDAIVGSTNMGGGTARGGAYVVFGPASGSSSLGTSDWILEHPGNYAYLGRTVAALGDVNDDGRQDWGVASALVDVDGDGDGAAYVFTRYGSGEDDVTTEATAILDGTADNDGLGRSLAGPGDVDGDGVDDVLVGAWLSDEAGNGAGSAALFLGPVTLDRSASDADALFTGETAGDYAGDAVGGGGDINDDGRADLVIGAYAQASSNRGSAYVIYGSASIGDASLGAANVIVRGVTGSQYLGVSVDIPGDVDMDGRDDLLLGAGGRDECDSTDGAGTTYLFLSPLSATMDSDDADTVITGAAAGDCAGAQALGAGDPTGDGYPDLLVAAPGADGVGAAYLVPGVGM